MDTKTSFAVVALVSLMTICGASEASVACSETPAADAEKFSLRKKVKSSEGVAKASDDLTFSNKKENSECFNFETMHNNLHTCSLWGQAEKVAPDKWEYKDAQCHIFFLKKGHSIQVRVSDPKDADRDFCQPAEEFGCGVNTSIDSGTYRRH